MNDTLRSQLDRVQSRALVSGVAGLAACSAGALFNHRQLFASYLFAYLFWLGLVLGCLSVVMLHHLTGGRWGFPIRRFLEAAIATLPLMLVLFVPLLFGLHDLYAWARPEEIVASKILQHKHVYLNPPAFTARAGFFLVLWIVMASLLNKWSFQQDTTPDPAPTRRLRTLSGPGIVVYPITATFAYVDWVMSLEPDWYSTMFFVIILAGQVLSALAFMIMLLAWLGRHEPLAGVVTPTHFHHLGNLLLAFVMFWAYVAFGQLLIIWSGNLPYEIVWYLHRSAGGWKWIVVFLALFHFFIPFCVLLSRRTKIRVAALTIVAAAVFGAHAVDVFWLVAPSFHPAGFALHWMDFAALVGVGGIWIAAFLAIVKRRALLPRNDPRFAIAHAS
jgi:hypothetical protein